MQMKHYQAQLILMKHTNANETLSSTTHTYETNQAQLVFMKQIKHNSCL